MHYSGYGAQILDTGLLGLVEALALVLTFCFVLSLVSFWKVKKEIHVIKWLFGIWLAARVSYAKSWKLINLRHHEFVLKLNPFMNVTLFWCYSCFTFVPLVSFPTSHFLSLHLQRHCQVGGPDHLHLGLVVLPQRIKACVPPIYFTSGLKHLNICLPPGILLRS